MIDDDVTNTTNTIISLHLHLVRHGETIANLQNNVIGQSDSPLTELGKQQVRALGKWLSSTKSCPRIHFNKNVDIHNNGDTTTDLHPNFWRIYSSDLGRTKATTQLLIKAYNHTSAHSNLICNNIEDDTSVPNGDSTDTVRYDIRLREIARGLRQGLSKAYTYDEAAEIYARGEHPLYSHNKNSDDITSIPPLETEDDGWYRMYTEWFTELVQDIFHDMSKAIVPISPYHVLVVTHAALLRVFLQRLIGTTKLQQNPQVEYKYDNNDTGIPINNRLHIPNTSYTVLQIELEIPSQQPPHSHQSSSSSSSPHIFSSIHLPMSHCDDQQQQQRMDNVVTTSLPVIQRIEIERFTSTDHFQYIE